MTTDIKIVSLSREQLHALVWEEPMTRVAARFGITDVALRKKCSQHSVPFPGRGYWQQRDAGKRPVTAALPDILEDRAIQFCVRCSVGASFATSDQMCSTTPLSLTSVRTRADHRAEAQQKMHARKQHLEAIVREQRETRARYAEERKAAEKLEADAIAWERAQRIRAYIGAVLATEACETIAADRATWVEWAHRQADEIDPLSRSRTT